MIDPASPDHTNRGVRLGVALFALGGWLTCPTAFALAELANVAKVAAGGYHTCALTKAGAVNCWGLNDRGQLGDGTGADRRLAVNVSGLSSGVVDIAAGAEHTCALTRAGGVKCWGSNTSGQAGPTGGGGRPQDVQGLTSGVAAIAAGGFHTCALTTGGAVKCWGNNEYGQLGDGSNARNPAPADVRGLSGGVAAIAAGQHFSCAITSGGAVKCWGVNMTGQMGDSSGIERLEPVDIPGLSGGVVAIDAGANHACALTGSGEMKCWGSDYHGQLGDGAPRWDARSPRDVQSLGDAVVSLAAGWWNTCAVTRAGGVKCWGDNTLGELGDGGNVHSSGVPVDVVGLSRGATQVDVGGYHVCAVLSSGGVRCWGRVDEGQIGDGGSAYLAEPTDVPGVTDATGVVAGSSHTCVLAASGTVKCWGDNSKGQLGDGTFATRFAPRDVAGLSSGVVAIAAGSEQTCALSASGTVRCWARPDDDPARNTPGDPEFSGGASAIAVGGSMRCALGADGKVRCWGFSTVECTGLDFLIGGPLVCHSVPHPDPEEFPGYLGSRRLAMSSSGGHMCAITAQGGVHCGGAQSSALPTNGFAEVAVGPRELCAISNAGGVSCWTEWTSPSLTATRQILGPGSAASAIAVGRSHACAVAGNGAVRCWGQNALGQLGNGSRSDSIVSAPVTSIESGARAVAVGDGHTCAVSAAGNVKCWGSNATGQLGVDTSWTGHRDTPRVVYSAVSTPNYTALWWNPGEPGWGLNVSHQGDTLFATLFTYARDGAALWLVASNLARQPDGSFSGALLRTSGPPFNHVPWTPISISDVGTMSLRFPDHGTAILTYTFGGVTVTKWMARQLLGTCTPGTGSRASVINYQDLWWNPAESGWGVNLAHQGDILFATLFTYSSTGRDAWLVASRLDRHADGSFSGPLYRTTGPPFDASPWRPITVAEVGTMALRFSSGEAGVLDYTVSGIAVTKNIARQVFGSTVPFCE